MTFDRLTPACFGIVLAAALTLAPPAAPPARAMGGTDDAAATTTGETPPTEGEGTATQGTGTAGSPPVTCPSGFTLNAETKKCEQQSGGLVDELPAVGWAEADPAFVEAAVLAHSGQYEAAIAALAALGRPDDPYVLNYLGFANRKLGRLDTALAYYHKALSVRPDYVRAREYLGEGLVALGRIDEAREQLALIERACGTSCDAWRKLDAAIAGRVATNG